MRQPNPGKLKNSLQPARGTTKIARPLSEENVIKQNFSRENLQEMGHSLQMGRVMCLSYRDNRKKHIGIIVEWFLHR